MTVSNQRLLCETDSTFITCTVRQRQLWLYRHLASYPEADPSYRVVSVRDNSKSWRTRERPQSLRLGQVDRSCNKANGMGSGPAWILALRNSPIRLRTIGVATRIPVYGPIDRLIDLPVRVNTVKKKITISVTYRLPGQSLNDGVEIYVIMQQSLDNNNSVILGDEYTSHYLDVSHRNGKGITQNAIIAMLQLFFSSSPIILCCLSLLGWCINNKNPNRSLVLSFLYILTYIYN